MDVERLYREHSETLFRYLLRLTGDPELAADAVQESFLRLVERPPEEERARAWLFRVATNLVVERGRARSRQLRLLERSPDRVPVGDAPLDPEAELERREREREVREALEALSPRDRTVLLMRAEGFAHREIAEVVGTTTQSMGSIILRAAGKLAKELRRDREALP